MCFPAFSSLARKLLLGRHEERIAIMAKECDNISTGSVLEKFELISYDEDPGRMMVSKKFDDGSEWHEPVAISIPDLFYLFKDEGVDPTEMIEESSFEFKKAKIKIGCWNTTDFEGDEEGCVDADSCYWQCSAVRM